MPMVGGARAGIGGVRLADGNSGSGGGGTGQCGCFPTVPTIVGDESGGGLNDVDVSGLGTDEEWVYWVESVGAPFRLDRSTLAAGLTVDNITIAGVLGEANSRWVRLQWENPTWQAQTHWAIDHDNGDDENLGCGTTDAAALLVPLRTTAEWRRRIQGAHYTSVVTVSVRRSSLVSVDDDDGLFTEFTTPIDSDISVNIVGLATVVTNGTGTLSAVQNRSLNTAQTITDGAQTWAANSLISSTAGTRMIRKTNGAWHAFVLEAISATEVLISNPTNVSETPSATPGNTTTNPAVNDTYQVCSLTPWPEIRSAPGGRVRKYLLDTVASTTPTANNGRLQSFDLVQAILCGWRVAYACNQQDGVNAYTCCFASTVTFGPTITRSCGFLGATSVQNGFTLNLQSLINTWAGAGVNIQIRHHGTIDCVGTAFFHNLGATAPIAADFLSGVSLANGSVAGSGMTGQIISADRSVVYGGANAIATTSNANPYSLNGITSNSIPMVDDVTGGAIYS